MLSARHSYHTTPASEPSSRQSAKAAMSETYTKSEESSAVSSSEAWSTSSSAPPPRPRPRPADYYKRYEHDELPVKDSAPGPRPRSLTDSAPEPRPRSLTDSALDKLERRIFASMSRDLRTDDTSRATLESNVKFFKSTVERIFDSFYASMQDFEAYKERFRRILERSREGYLDDMEDFVRDMFEHIAAGERARRSDPEDASGSGDSPRASDADAGIVDSYRNEHYLTDSTLQDDDPRSRTSKIDDILNVILFGEGAGSAGGGGRAPGSQVEVRRARPAAGAASADNLRVRAAKRAQLDAYAARAHDGDATDRDIPVKVSCPKKNIHTDEDFARAADSADSFRSFISRLCNVLCKRFRRTS